METVSQSESGFEKEYQSSVLIPHWRFGLKEGGEWSVKIRLTMREI
ncbi:MAG: alpha-amylase/4-alpha-glucanotransferase domain-containing protein [Nitrospirota bacterium]